MKTKEEIIKNFLNLKNEISSVPSLLELVQQTDVKVDDLQRCFPAANVLDSFVKMANECSQQREHWCRGVRPAKGASHSG